MSQWLPITEIAKKVNRAELSAVDLVNQSLKTIEQHKEYDAIISVLHEPALTRAKLIDDQVKQGQSAGRLAGVPFIAKDNFLVFGSDTTAGSNMLRGFKAPYQATAINKLEAEGAICVAKANLDAFAHGTSTENSDFMVTKNPHDKTRVPGGSSGGSAASVVLDMVPFALGTDTGGSIRLPASFSGCVGFKPSYGLISRSGVVAMASSTDVIGPLTKTVDDTAIVLDVMAGKDPLDATTIDQPVNLIDKPVDLQKAKIAIIKEYFGDGVNQGVKQVLTEAIDKLRANGATISEVSLPSVDMALAIYYIICPAEVSSNLSRYDGLRYGFHEDPDSTANLEAGYKLNRGHGFGKEAKRRIMIGTYVLSSGYYDAYYLKAQQARTKLINDFNLAFSNYDFLLGPVSPSVAFKIGENVDDPLKMYLCDIMTVAANIVGNPSISLPVGLSDNLPVGLQVMSKHQKDEQLIGFAKKIEELIS
jgi:aspartyl-tRNA(Asn)/glutamyl-tRNA(Gln) amidotransferase subunit A